MLDHGATNLTFPRHSGENSVTALSLSVFFIGITLVNFHLNWLNWFHFCILEGGLLAILVDFMIFSVTIPRF